MWHSYTFKGNQTYTQNVDKANVLNEHFSSAFTKPDTSSDHNPSLEGNPHPDISPLLIEENGVRALLQNLDPHKAQGPDGIQAKFLKETSNYIWPMLTLIFNASLQQGKPYVVPVFKKGSRTDPSNYRPISLTCICCKVFEHIIVSSISQYVSSLNFSVMVFGKITHVRCN